MRYNHKSELIKHEKKLAELKIKRCSDERYKEKLDDGKNKSLKLHYNIKDPVRDYKK